MQIEHFDGKKEKEFFDSIPELTGRLDEAMRDKTVKKITIWPAKRIPGKRRKK